MKESKESVVEEVKEDEKMKYEENPSSRNINEIENDNKEDKEEESSLIVLEEEDDEDLLYFILLCFFIVIYKTIEI